MSAAASIPVFTAVTGAPWEADLVTRLEHPRGVNVVRRCVDLADLLAAAGTGTGRAALVAADLRRLDRDALGRLATAGVVPVGVVTPGDVDGTARLHLLGVPEVVHSDSAAEVVVAAINAALRSAGKSAGVENSFADPMAALSRGATAIDDPPRTPPAAPGGPGGPGAAAPTHPALGRIIAVWGPTGAPGRTTVAVGVAAELAAAGLDTVLADADVYGGVVAQVLGLLDESPGLAAAVRQANAGTLDLAGLARLAPVVTPHLRVLTGLSRPDRWPELRAAALEPVWSLTRQLAPFTVVDCGFSLERDEELSFDTTAPRRNGATLLTLELADVVLAVGGADPVGMTRLVRALGELREAVPGRQVRVVLNKVRRGPVGADPERQLAAALHRYAGVRDVHFVAYDQAALDAALLVGRSLAEVAPHSPARRGLHALAGELVGRPARARRRPLIRRPALS